MQFITFFLSKKLMPTTLTKYIKEKKGVQKGKGGLGQDLLEINKPITR